MKNDPIMTVLIRHVTAKQAYQIRGIAESTALQSRPLTQLQSSVRRHVKYINTLKNKYR